MDKDRVINLVVRYAQIAKEIQASDEQNLTEFAVKLRQSAQDVLNMIEKELDSSGNTPDVDDLLHAGYRRAAIITCYDGENTFFYKDKIASKTGGTAYDLLLYRRNANGCVDIRGFVDGELYLAKDVLATTTITLCVERAQ